MQYLLGENLAWNYDDPFGAWYDDEKALYEQDKADGVLDHKDKDGNPIGSYGHYLNIINPDHTVTGAGHAPGVDGQTFSHRNLVGDLSIGTNLSTSQAEISKGDRFLTVDEYAKDLQQYVSMLDNAKGTYESALKAVEDAQAKASAAAAKLKTAREHASKTSREVEIAQARLTAWKH